MSLEDKIANNTAALLGLTAAINALLDETRIAKSEAQEEPEAKKPEARREPAPKTEKPAATEPTAEEYAAPESKEENSEISLEAGRELCRELLKLDKQAFLEILKSYGAEKLPQIPEDKFQEAMAMVKTKLAELED